MVKLPNSCQDNKRATCEDFIGKTIQSHNVDDDNDIDDDHDKKEHRYKPQVWTYVDDLKLDIWTYIDNLKLTYRYEMLDNDFNRKVFYANQEKCISNLGQFIEEQEHVIEREQFTCNQHRLKKTYAGAVKEGEETIYSTYGPKRRS